MAFVRRCGNIPSVTDQLEIERRRERLQKRIDVWYRQGKDFIPVGDVEEPTLRNESLNYDECWTDPADEDDLFQSAPDDDTPETSCLPLPSALTSGLSEVLGERELALRQGQANDALHAIRIALGQKAFLFRTSVRNAKSQRTKTRAWDGINSQDATVRQHARIYSRARDAMVALSATADLLQRYRELSPGDLKASTAIADPSRPNHRNDQLAWFWKVDAIADSADESWMQECAKPSSHFTLMS